MRGTRSGVRWRVLVSIACVALCRPGVARGAEQAALAGAAQPKPSLADALAKLVVPPAWFAEVKPAWDTAKPWKDARLEIRRLLALGTETGNRQAVKLTYQYMKKQDIGNGHEYPMYLFLAGETAWATREYVNFLRKEPDRNTHAYLALASCYSHFGEYAKAVETYKQAMQHLPPDNWRIARQADVYNAWGDLCAATGDRKQAREHYAKAAELYPQSKQPYGRHLLARQAAKVRAKLDMLDMARIEAGKLRDGRYTGDSQGYSSPLQVTVVVRGGGIADLTVKHKEKIHQNAPEIIPRRIIKAQSLKVDAVTGATVTCQAIVDASLQALRKAGHK